MREILLRHPRTLVAAVIAVIALFGVGSFLVISGLPQPTPAEPPPQAAASAPQPTLVSAEATAQATAPPAQPPDRGGPVHHTVTEGEVLWQIAEQYNLRPETVLWANDIQDPDLLLIGQDLLIPPTDGVLYTVRPGDGLADVANRYGVDLQAIISSNHLDNADQIQAGADIFLPGGRPLAATSPPATDTAQAGEGDQ